MIILVGVPGSGKSSILNEVRKNIPYLQVVNYGDKMLQVAASQNIDRDLIRKLPIEQQKNLRLTAAKKIVEESNATTIVDTHALIKTKHGYNPGLPKEILEILAPVGCVLIECAPSIIMQRRAHDTAIRQRDAENEEELLAHQELSRTYLCACCLMTGALFCHINNSLGSIEQNALPLIKLIESLNS